MVRTWIYLITKPYCLLAGAVNKDAFVLDSSSKEYYLETFS